MTTSFRGVLGLILASAIGLPLSGCGPSSSSSSPAAPAGSASSAPAPAAEEAAGTASPAQAAPAGVAAVATGWGDLKGRFVYDGTPVQPARLNVTKDQEVCGQHELVDESLAVNPENRGLANVVLFLYLKRGDSVPEAHESYASAGTTVQLDNDACRFAPHVAVMTTGQTLVIGNKDTVGHNTKIDATANPPCNQNLPANSTIEQQFAQPERLPIPVSCSIHPWMKGYLLVRDNPYSAVTNENGEFEIKNLPAGNWTFQVWHEAGTITEATLAGGKQEWSRGRVDVTIQGGSATDLGEVKVSPALLGK